MLLFLHGGLVRRKLLLSGKVVYGQLTDADSDRVFSLTVGSVFEECFMPIAWTLLLTMM